MSKKIPEHTHKIFDELYTIVTSEPKWPSFFNKSKKINFVNYIKDFYNETEDYGKCSVLEKIIIKLEDED